MLDLSKIKEFYKLSKGLTLESALQLQRASKKIKFVKNEILINKGSTKNDIFFVTKGLVRTYYVDKKGEEVTIVLSPEHHMVANIDYLFSEEPSKYIHVALEDTKAFVLDFDKGQEILNKDKGLSENIKYVYLKYLSRMFRRIESFVLLSPEERYINYVKEFPSLTNRVPDKYIANVLGITPVSLSRIRKRMMSKK